MNYNTITLEEKDQVAKITFNRPEKLNAISPEVISEVKDALEKIRKSSSRVVIITGAEMEGKRKMFSAGADLTKSGIDPFSPKSDTIRESSLRGQEMCNIIAEFEKPVIAMVNGLALGGGCETLLACDIVIASETAEIGLPEIGLGIIPGWGGTQRLPRKISPSKAKQIIFTGERISATEAEKIGLVDVVAPADRLEDATMEVAKKLAAKSPIILRLAKRAVNQGLETSLKSGLKIENDAFVECFSTEDVKEGMQAFFEKRQPKFKGE
ncbi:MAG: enoyl-CoA hydratase/isomerase family protein [Candidatus Atabeyarchaeum deiterrae]|jgi:enoyl-CoA hydratase/carnithine racemase